MNDKDSKTTVNASDDMPKAMRWDDIFSAEYTARQVSEKLNMLSHSAAGMKRIITISKPSVMQSLHRVLEDKIKDILSLGPGVAPRHIYPLDNFSFESYGDLAPVNTQIEMKKFEPGNDTDNYDLAVALDYGQATGCPQLLSLIEDHIKTYHCPLYSDWKCALTVGNTSALDIALRMFTERGDHVLVEEYTYPTFVETALPLGLRITGVPMDEYGLRPDSLDNTLQSWNEAEEGKRPRIIYVIPTGQNPTGTTASLTRRRELYRIAQRWNLYILEDDPYYFVQFNGRGKENTSSPHQLVESLVPSYLNIDTDGRVFRMDTVSKVIAPGLRMGWVTASEQVIQRLVWAQETSVQNPSGLSQIVMLRLLQRWSQEGFGQWVWNLQSFYLTKRDTMKDVIDRFLPAEIVSYVLPQAGFYVWLRIDSSRHPATGRKTHRQIENEIYKEALTQGALVIPGSWFQPQRDIEQGGVFFRVSFALPSAEKMEEAIRRFGVALRSCFSLD